MPEFTFTVDSALLSELGEKLVASVHIALSELVKNAYDADATKVTVAFRPQTSEGPEIEITDNGTGMKLDEVRRYWMKIGTPHKQKNPLSRLFGRPRTGKKGIGRFCCRRLGRKLILQTTAKRDDGRLEQTEVTFDWMTFSPGKDVAEVNCPGQHRIVGESKTGTKLIITGSPDDEWSQRGFNFLRRQLAVLVANRGAKRPDFEPDPGFEVKLEAPDFSGGVGDLRDQLLKAGWGTIRAHLDESGKAVCVLDAKDIGHKRIVSGREFKHLRGVTLTIGIMPHDKEQFRDKGVLSQTNLNDISKDWGGVQVRHNGFRVFPYGDDDWLGIDRDRGSRKGAPSADELFTFANTLQGVEPSRCLLSMLSMRSYIGTVEVGNQATGLELRASREGFVGGGTFDELVEFTRFCVDWSTIYRDFSLRQKPKQEAERARERLQEVLQESIEPALVVRKAIDFVQKEFVALASVLPPEERQEKREAFFKATNAIAFYDNSKESELYHLRLIASTSTLVLIFSHEIKALLGTLEASSASLRTLERKLDRKEVEALEGIRSSLVEAKRRFGDLIDMTTLIGVDSRNAKPTRLHLRDRVEKSVDCYKVVREHYDLDVDISGVPNDILVGPMVEAEVYAILLNTLSNAIKSVVAAGGTKKVAIRAERRDGNVVLSVLDTGIGLNESQYENVFLPFVADPEGKLYPNLDRRLNPEDRYLVGTGSGLGLAIVRDIVRNRHGNIRFVNPGKNWRAHLEIYLP